MVKFIWFSDGKLFPEAVPVNTQNDCPYVVPAATKKRDTCATRLLKSMSSFRKSVVVSVAVSSLRVSNIHVLESAVKIHWRIQNRDVVFETDAVSGHPCGIWKGVFCLSAAQCPITLCQRRSSADRARDARFISPTSGRLTRRLTTVCGVCFRSESIVPRSRMDVDCRRTETTH